MDERFPTMPKNREICQTPNNIEILIHYYTCPEPHPRFDSPAVKGAINRFIEDHIFELDHTKPSTIRVSPKGKAWIKMILLTPYPKRAWIDDHNNIIDIEE